MVSPHLQNVCAASASYLHVDTRRRLGTAKTIRQQILGLIDFITPDKTLKELAKEFYINYSSFRREIAQLRKDGILEKTGRGKYKPVVNVEGLSYEEMKRFAKSKRRILSKKEYNELWQQWREAN